MSRDTWRTKSSKKKFCPFTQGKLSKDLIDFTNPGFLRRYIGPTGKIVPSRITGLENPYQHKIALAIRRARYLGLLPYCDRHDKH